MLSFFAAMIFAVQGCYTEHFNYVDATHPMKRSFDCHIIKGIGTVDKSGDSIVIYAGGIVTIRRLYQNFNVTDFWARVSQGDKMRVRMRTIDLQDSVAPGIALTLGKDQSVLQMGESPSRSIAPRIDAGWQHIELFSEGKIVQVVVNCDTVYTGTTNVIATDMFAIESVDNSEVHVRGLSQHGVGK